MFLNNFPNNKFLGWSEMRGLANNKINATEKLKVVLESIDILWEMENVLVTSIFSFSYNIFKRLLCQCHKNSGLCGKGL